DLELAGEVLAGELLVLPDVGGDHASDPLLHEQLAQAPVGDAAVVGNCLDLVDAGLEQRVDQHRRDAAESEAADREGRTALDVGDRLGGAGHHLVHGTSFLTWSRGGSVLPPIAVDSASLV